MPGPVAKCALCTVNLTFGIVEPLLLMRLYDLVDGSEKTT